MRRTVRVCLLAVALAASVLAGPARAAPTCAFDPATGRVDVLVSDGESTTLGRQGDAITLDAVACGVATVLNTDQIVVTGSGTPVQVTIDLSGGDLTPGLTAETDGGASEIELSVDLPAGSPTLRIAGGADVDTVVVGSGGINLNAEEAAGDVDLTIAGTATIVVEGGDGADVLSLAGGVAEGTPVSGATLSGGPGDDLLLAGPGPNVLDGGEGTDTADYTAATQLLPASLTDGTVQHVEGATDQIAAVENVTGSPGDDTIVGDAGDNVLRGEAGDDALDGGGGDDALDGGGGDDALTGGDGVDTAEFRSAAGVTVDLRAGTATGAGDDQLAEVENVTGSGASDTILGDDGDNVLRGLDKGDEIRGGGGNDLVRGGKGGDLLFGGAGDDLLRAGHGKDQLNGGEGEDVCRGARDPDSFVFCENYPTRD